MLPLRYERAPALSPKEYVSNSRAGNFNFGALCLHCAPFVGRRWSQWISW